jgi:pimeloyl-ACP methyl ester carboxylesterase
VGPGKPADWGAVRTAFRAILVVIVIALVALMLRLFVPASTAPFRDDRGRILPHSIARIERWKINGIAESVILRGRDIKNPVLVWIHGGPGSSETPILRCFNAPLEDHFVVVYWDQRYAGRSLDPFAPPPSHVSIDDYVSDLDVLVDRLKARFHVPKVVLVAHSWGTLIGALYAEKHPENVSAYVGIGQVANSVESEKRSYAFALDEARKRHDAEALEELIALGPPPRRDALPFTPRDLLARYGGAYHQGDISLPHMTLIAAGQSEANWREPVAILLADKYDAKAVALIPQVILDKDHTQFRVPVILISGRYDRVSDASVAYRYFESISAPRKEFVWFEQSAHSPPFEEPAKFNAWIIDNVRPLAAQ